MTNESLHFNFTSNEGNENAKKIIQLLEKGDQLVSRTQYGGGLPEVTLVLGNTGAGKSTFTRWFTNNDDNFISKEDEQTPGEYVIIDPTSNSTINTATTASTTIFPELVVNKKNNAYFYDFPGFGDTRGVAHDIAVAYFIKKAIDNSKSIKIVFVVKYDSVTGKAVRDDFMSLIRHVSKFIRNIEKFKDGIALIATRVWSNLPREKVINGIALFIKKAKGWLEEQERTEHVDHTMEKELMEVFLSKEGENYPKIGLFVAPDQEGSLRTIPSLQENKKNTTIMLDKLKFVEKNDSDFGYTIPKQSLIDVDGVINDINKGIVDNVRDSGKEVQKYILSKEEQLCDIFELYSEANSRYNELLKMKEEANKQPDPKNCVQRLIGGFASMNSDHIRQILATAVNNSRFSSILQIVSGSLTKDSFKCAEGLNEVIEYSDHSKKWYQFLINLYNDMSEYQAQCNRGNGSCIQSIKTITENKQNEKNASILNSFINECLSNKRYNLDDLSSIPLHKPEFDALARVLNFTLNYDLFKSCNKGKLVMKGPYIKFGDIQNALKNTCKESPKFIEIFALNKVFVDIDLNLIGQNVHLSVISPTWEIQGNRKIVLDGAEGKPHNSQKASSGKSSGDNGQNGAPGLPGGHGGNFFGIGETFINFSDLTVSVNGGKGGGGQDGGDGMAGSPGADAYNDLYRKKNRYYSRYHYILKYKVLRWFITPDESEYVLAGRPGGSGGSGGNGGRGGMGGYPGDITMISVSPFGDSINMKMEKRAGSNGSNGFGGQGRLGGMPGRDLRVYLDHHKLAFLGIGSDDVTETLLGHNSMGRAQSGRNGGTGENYEWMVEATQNNPLPNRREIVNSCTAYLEGNLNCNSSVNQSQLREFLNNIKNSDSVKNRLRKRRSIDQSAPEHNINYKSQILQDSTISSGISKELEPVNQDGDIGIKPHYLTAEDTNSAKNSAIRFNSPINTAVNLVTNFIGQLAFFKVVNVMNPQSARGGIESIFGKWKQSNVHTTTGPKDYANRPSNLAKFNVNGSLALADFAIRWVTKVKPYNSQEQRIDFSEVRILALRIVGRFEKISNDLFAQCDLPVESLEFDPVILMSKVEKEIINQNYTKIGELLIQSIVKDSHFKDTSIHNFVQGEIDKILWEQNKWDSYNHHQVEEKSNLIIMQNSFSHIDYQSGANYLPRLE